MWLLDEPEFDPTLLDWLAGLNPERLERILTARPDVLEPSPPRRLDELAERLSSAESVRAARLLVGTPGVQLLRALQLGYALGHEQGVPPATLAGWLAGDADPRAVLDFLAGLALAWPDPSGAIHLPEPLRGDEYRTYGLGASLAELLPQATIAELKRLRATLGLSGGVRKPQLVDVILGVLRDPGHVRELLAGAPEGTVELLNDTARHGPTVPVERRSGEPAEWALRHALLWTLPTGEVVLPLEVAVTLRGPELRLPLDPAPPELSMNPADPADVAVRTSAAALRLVDRVHSVLDAAATEPLPTLRYRADIGPRVVKRLARDIGATPAEVRLVLDLATATSLLTVRELEPEPPTRARPIPPPPDLGVVPAERAARLRSAGSAALFRTLLGAWWTLDASPLADEHAVRGLGAAAVRHLRQLTLRLLCHLEPGSGLADEKALLELARWAVPAVPASAADALVRGSLAEAELLGVVADGAPGELAYAMVAAGPRLDPAAPELTGIVDRLLTGAGKTALFGADLTAVVAGAPDVQLAALLDSVADRESQGAATTWRFSRASVRRAFDRGTTAPMLLDELAAVARDELPQPLVYLINDVARRHGEVAVIGVAGVVVGEDEAVVTEIAGHKAAGALGLRRVAPTVLVATVDPDTVLRRLRRAGFAPVRRDVDGALVIAEPALARVAEPEPEPAVSVPSPRAHAERLLTEWHDRPGR
ncbi:Helicase conserved C-terminal domain-containing protein [Amycolatopsis arida]|uniref:Helicase conserved C-terminal domain-containing protein n=2 Tax=Amycolatopsis arida TaxID=587909 RepID=A0A1I5YM45_9PSEU|nr:XPB/Ssl2-like helicase family protein [Amycolatopsis arida]SFQ45339.1 Helicase conserved C-terminal domain-containing protein [Amycolatopsis arida]